MGGPNNEDEDAWRFRSEMRTKITNLLRICHAHGHRELIISSRFTGSPAREVASLFRELLTKGDKSGESDVAHAFRRVIFAMPKSECTAKCFVAFDEEFGQHVGTDAVPEGLVTPVATANGRPLTSDKACHHNHSEQQAEDCPWRLHSTNVQGVYTLQDV